jgi:cytochrome P450
MQPAFQHAYLPGYAAVMREEIAAMLSKWRDGETVDMVEEMFTLTTTVVLRTLFSSRISAQDADELRTVFDVVLRGVYTRAALPLVGALPTRSNRRYAKSMSSIRTRTARTPSTSAASCATAPQKELWSSQVCGALRPGTATTGGIDTILFSAGIDDEQHGLIWALRVP